MSYTLMSGINCVWRQMRSTIAHMRHTAPTSIVRILNRPPPQVFLGRFLERTQDLCCYGLRGERFLSPKGRAAPYKYLLCIAVQRQICWQIETQYFELYRTVQYSTLQYRDK